MKPIKNILLFNLLLMVSYTCFAQKQAFDVINYTMPNGWDKTEMEKGIQLSTKNDGKGNYATAVILRSAVSIVSEEPTMQAPATEKGWSVISGQAGYTDGANKGWVTLISATGNGKMASKNIYSITVPPTWSLNEGGNSLTLEKNTTTGKRIIELMNMVRSSGNLEKDMEHIFFEVFDGWNIYNGSNNQLFEKGDHEKGVTCQGLSYYMLSNSITKPGGDVIKGTVLIIQVGANVAIINTADKILGSESEMALNFLLFTLKINGVADKNVDYKKQLIGTWASGSGSYGNSLIAATSYTAEGKYYVLTQSSYTVGYDYYNDLIKSKQFKGEGVFAFKGNVLERKTSSGSSSNYFIRFYSRKYGNNAWGDVMGLYQYDYDKNKIETLLPFQKL